MNKTTLKSMASLAFYLLILVAVWAVIGVMVYPFDKQNSTPADFVQENATMLTQVAQNAMDPEQWPGIRTVPEIAGMLEKGGIQDIQAYDVGAAFVLPSDNVEAGRYICYDSTGDDFLNAAAHITLIAAYPNDWTLTESTVTLERWQGGAFGKGYYNISKLADSFYLVDYYNPT